MYVATLIFKNSSKIVTYYMKYIWLNKTFWSHFHFIISLCVSKINPLEVFILHTFAFPYRWITLYSFITLPCGHNQKNFSPKRPEEHRTTSFVSYLHKVLNYSSERGHSLNLTLMLPVYPERTNNSMTLHHNFTSEILDVTTPCLRISLWKNNARFSTKFSYDRP